MQNNVVFGHVVSDEEAHITISCDRLLSLCVARFDTWPAGSLAIRCPRLMYHVLKKLPDRIENFADLVEDECDATIQINHVRFTIRNNHLIIESMGMVHYSAAISTAERESLAAAMRDHMDFLRRCHAVGPHWRDDD